MKKQTKGVFFAVLFGGGLLFWATAATIPGTSPDGSSMMSTETGTPADNFPDEDRPRFCESGQAKSGTFITEYKIPTNCTQPLAMTSDPTGGIWFAQTNTGRIASFDPVTEVFSEFDNPSWPIGGRSMMWGADHVDGSIWFTDETYDSVWGFSLTEAQYSRLNFPSRGNSLPQTLEAHGSQIIVNDFTGGKLTFLNPQAGSSYFDVPSPLNGSFTSGFDVEGGSIWYSNWMLDGSGVLVRFDQNAYATASGGGSRIIPLFDYMDLSPLPEPGLVINGITAGPGGQIWLMDSASSSFFGYDKLTGIYTKYVTSDPPISAYGNATGIITAPISRPYWSAADDFGRLVFTEQTANSIAVFDPESQSLTEYVIPSKNPNWSDCEGIEKCGLAQVFGITLQGTDVWFTEWVENNIGVLDTQLPLPFTINPAASNVTIAAGQEGRIILDISRPAVQTGNGTEPGLLIYAVTGDIEVIPDTAIIAGDGPQQVGITIIPGESAAGEYKVLLGVRTDDVTVSRYVTLYVV